MSDDDRRDYWRIAELLLLEPVVMTVFGIFRWLHAPRWTVVIALLINLSIIWLYGKWSFARIPVDARVGQEKVAKRQALAKETQQARETGWPDAVH